MEISDQEKQEFNKRLEELAKEHNIPRNQALDLYLKMEEERIKRETNKEMALRKEATKRLLDTTGPKMILIGIDGFIPKDQAYCIAHSSIRVKSHHILNEVAYGEILKWLLASEVPLDKSQAQQVLNVLNESGLYSEREIEVIVSDQVPFDIRFTIK